MRKKHLLSYEEPNIIFNTLAINFVKDIFVANVEPNLQKSVFRVRSLQKFLLVVMS